MNTYATTAFLALIFNTSVGLLVWIKSSDRRLGKYFGLVSLNVSFWILGCLGQSYFKEKYSYMSDVILYTGATLAPTLYLHFLLTFTDSVEKLKKTLRTCYTVSFIFLSLNWIPFARVFFIPKITHRYEYRTIAEPGPLWFVFIILYSICAGYCILLLWRFLKTSTGYKRNQVKYFLFSFLALCIGGTMYFSLVIGINLPPIDNVFTMTYGLIMTYSILRHKLMDFSIVMRWGLAYGLLVSFILAIIIPLTIFSEWLSRKYFHFSPGFSSLGIACLLVVVIDPIKKRIKYFVDKEVFKSPDFQELLLGFDEMVINANSIYVLSENISKMLKNIWKSEHAGLAVWNFKSSSFDLLPSYTFERQIVTKLNEKIQKEDFLVKTLESERRLFKDGVVVEDEITTYGNRASLGERTTLWKIRRTMRWLGASVCVPLSFNGQLIGFIILGKKKNNSVYNDEDRKFLTHISERISLTVRNLLVSETNTSSLQAS